MKRIIIYLTIAFLSIFCFAKAQAQGVTMFGISNSSRTTDTSKTWGQLVVPYLASSDTNKIVGITSSGHFVLRTKSPPDLSGFLQKTDTSRSGIVSTYWYVDSLYSTIGTHDSLVKYSDSNSVYVTTYGLDTAKANLRTSIAAKVKYSDSNSVYVTTYGLDTAKANLRTSIAAKVKYSDSNSVYVTTYGLDTAKANLRTSIAAKVKYSDSNSVYVTTYGLDTAKANLRTSIAAKVKYSDTAGFLPTKTFLANNYFANGGNSFGATATLGTNGSNALDFETNNTVRGRIGATGNWMLGTTTDAGYRLDVNGTGRFTGILSSTGGISVLTGGLAANIINGTSNTLNANNNIISGRVELFGSANQSTMLDIIATPVGNVGYTLQYFRANNFVRSSAGSFKDYIIRMEPVYNYSAGTHTVTGLYYNPTLTNVSGLANHRAMRLVTGDVVMCETSGIVGIGTNSPSEKLHVTGKVRIDTIPTVTTYDSVLVNVDGVIKAVLFKLSASATLDFPSTASNENSDLTISVPGAVIGDVVALGHGLTAQGTFEADVSAADTVTVRFHNTAAGVYDPPSDTFKVYVFK